MSPAFMRAIRMAASSGRFPTSCVLGWAEPFSIPASFLMRAVVGGVPTVTVNCFLSSTSILTGTCIPLKSAVLRLISFTTDFTLIPRGPRAGPRGWPGVALPPGTSTSTISPIAFPPRLGTLNRVRPLGYIRSCRGVKNVSIGGFLVLHLRGNPADFTLASDLRVLHLVATYVAHQSKILLIFDLAGNSDA